MVGETESRPTPGVTLMQKWTHFRITPSGFTFGYMNGMRPRGMLMHEGTVSNGVVTGVMRFGGIDFNYPDGMTPPDNSVPIPESELRDQRTPERRIVRAPHDEIASRGPDPNDGSGEVGAAPLQP